jgi:hypothetical protein
MTTPLVSILAMPKPFHGHIGVIQRNAITSWTKVLPRPRIFLFGEEEGTAQIAAELGLTHLHDIQRNEFGTPLLGNLIKRAREVTDTPLLCYSNSDIILLQAFQDAVSAIAAKFSEFLGVTHRWEIDLTGELQFSTDQPLDLRRLPSGVPGHHTAIDVFVFTRDVFVKVPALAIGRAWFDQWLIKEALLRGMPVVDMTSVARAIHQRHEYGHIAGGQQGAYGGEEARRNLEIYGGVPHAYTLLNVTHELLGNGVIRAVRYRREKFQAQQWLWRNFVQRTAAMRRRLGLSRSLEKSSRHET